MKLRYMELHNYRKFRDAKVEFPDGVVAIVGQNGTGKTTLLEAVTWALFGNESSVVRDGKEGVMSTGTSLGDDCTVLLEFELGGDGYKLVRSMKGKMLKVDASLEANGEVVATGDSAVTEAIISRLGMDHKAFFVSVFAKQKDLNALANLRPAERKKLVLRMLGVDFLDEVSKKVDHDATAAKREADQLSALLRDQQGRDKEELLKSEVVANEEMLRAVIERTARLAADRQQATDRTGATKMVWETEEERYRQDVGLERRLTGLRVGLQGRQETLARLVKEMDDLEKLRNTLPEMERMDQEYRKARTDSEGHGVLREKHLKRQRMLEDLTGRRRDCESLVQESAQAVGEMAKMPDVEGSLARVDVSLEEIRELASNIASQLHLAMAEKDRLQLSLTDSKKKSEEIGALGEDSNCPTCQRRMGRQYSDLLRRYQEEQESVLKNISQLETTRLNLQEQRERNDKRRKVLDDRRKELLSQSRMRASLEERVRQAQQARSNEGAKIQVLEKELETMGTVLYDQEAHDLARRRVTELEPLHLALSKAQAKMERLPSSKKQMEETTAAIALEEGEMRTVVMERKALNFDPRTLQERKKQYEEARNVEDRLTQELIRAEGEQRRLVSEKEGLSKREQELQEIRAKHGKLMGEQEMLNRLSQVMKGFKENVISRIVPTISQVSSDLLVRLTDGKYGGMRLDDDYQMYIYDQGQEHSLERFSGGESDLANLCLRLAISRMIMERSGSQMNFLVLDEIFGSQDQSRKRNILETLGQLQKQFRQILLITHIDDVKDNVSAVLKVTEKEDGSSTVVLEN